MITALILAAGQSRRMGQPKMLLPWGETTVLEKVIATFQAAGVDKIIVITGSDRERVEALVKDSARTVFNPDYAEGEMLSSVQAGLAGLLQPPPSPGATSPKSAPIHNFNKALNKSGIGGGREGEAVLIGLGDQPQVQESSVRAAVDEYRRSGAALVVPSFQKRRGHPWLVARVHWDEILRMQSPASLRDFLNHHADEIRYVELDNSSILQDLDTPDDYLKSKP
jgi:molybdenum cofactor cytidylyltransferase